MWVGNTTQDGSGGRAGPLRRDPFPRRIPHGCWGLLWGGPIGHALLLLLRLLCLLLHWLHALWIGHLAAWNRLWLLLLLLLLHTCIISHTHNHVTARDDCSGPATNMDFQAESFMMQQGHGLGDRCRGPGHHSGCQKMVHPCALSCLKLQSQLQVLPLLLLASSSLP